MKLENGRIIFSPADLKKFAECEHQSALDLRLLRKGDITPGEASEDMELVFEQGHQHEENFLNDLKESGHEVEEIGDDSDSAEQKTIEAMARGAKYIYQGVVSNGNWRGRPDFLERVGERSKDGLSSYEVIDTKLKRVPDASHILQLAIYSDLIGHIQGSMPEQMHIHLGSGITSSHVVREFIAYVRLLQTSLEEFTSVEEPPSRPIPCSACDFCRWNERCTKQWEDEDSLFRVANIRKTQVKKLEDAGIHSVEALAHHEGNVPRLAHETLATLRQQARLQHKAQQDGQRHWELRKTTAEKGAVKEKGFALLPSPSSGDLFYDIEGYPHYEEAGQRGLEYLHGVWDGRHFYAFWAHNLAEEKVALKKLFSLFKKHLDNDPGAHIFHYAHYEITALRKITARHSEGEAQLDNMLREERFVDLYAVARGGIVISEPRYSMKYMEKFYRGDRQEGVKTSAGSIIAYYRWQTKQDQAILDDLEAYNKVDCVSTQELRDWLCERRPKSTPPPEPSQIDPAQEERIAEREAHFEDLEQELDRSLDHKEETRSLLKNLHRFHSREAKPFFWKVFDSRGKLSEELKYDSECLGGLRASGKQFKIKRSLGRTYHFDPQPHKVKSGSRMQFWTDHGNWPTPVTVESIDRKKNSVILKFSKKYSEHLSDRLDLIPNDLVKTDIIHEAVRRVLQDQLDEKRYAAANELLLRNPPRFKDEWSLDKGPSATVDRLIAATTYLDQSVLSVQGPPGTGKTYTSSRTILYLVKQGHKIAVSSNSHAAIINLLLGCVKALDGNYLELQGSVTVAHKASSKSDNLQRPRDIRYAKNNMDPDLKESNIVGGTAWLFCRPEFDQHFDYLFVDEAGQVSLANLIGMSTCARNVVLIGDPCQLPQVIQGSHPPPANLSCLKWILDGDRIISDEYGIFLPETYRMHPQLCAFISEQYYEGKLGGECRY